MLGNRCRIQFTLGVSVLLFLLPALRAAQDISSESTASSLHNQDEERFKLSPNALKVARTIGVESAIVRLSMLTSTKDFSADAGASLKSLSFRQ